ncbi:NAD(P)-dependent oxidoreductase [Dactylosporangium sp. NPDC048998]|uniref:NAD(P)-dependent oxidoreductase n=1 Tax=Dactylosporangium sp. NPDC048998 TaxID=3363976 RepID=UPI00371726A1
MEITVLGATGGTGRQLVRQALERGHVVTAIARDPARLDVPDTPRLARVAADVRDPEAIARALAGAGAIVSGLGIASGEAPGALTAGARAAVAAAPGRLVWLGAFGTGTSAPAAGAPTRILLRTFMRGELPDRVGADAAVLAAGGTVLHAGPLSDGPLAPARRTLTLAEVPRRPFPARVSRATVAAAMLDEAESGAHPGMTLVPLGR